ncbi:hypothetical protein K443DRAFT_13941 [Laccaria amethystina LaAM-08-1]|uniref:Uncharacterized protein n=1 Tax=Laccaria amethystina LaAM-08-1 TaxID=1095629 RepID=A0A0C9WHY8_9AGAR|nr:hypothetical protein K443DRAFT_13941 [Laccaria amethystina LaAM-08-1]
MAVGSDTDQCTQDLATILVDPSKISSSSFEGIIIDLVVKFPYVLTFMMLPNPKNDHNLLRDLIKNEELRKPTMFHENEEGCLLVLKSGRESNLTVGRANNICSYTHNFLDNEISNQRAILPFDNVAGHFSARGDSGFAIVDGAGRMGGIITSGAGSTDSFDVTYATPIEFVMKSMHANQVLAEAFPFPTVPVRVVSFNSSLPFLSSDCFFLFSFQSFSLYSCADGPPLVSSSQTAGELLDTPFTTCERCLENTSFLGLRLSGWGQ